MSESSFPQMKALDSFISKISLAYELNNTMSLYLETVASINGENICFTSKFAVQFW